MKIYAKQISPEYQESPLFLGDEFWPEGIILDGNRDNCLVKRVDKLMRQLGAEQDRYGAYHFDTDCGKMRVKVDEFRPKCERIWVYTCVENPELAKQQFHRTEIFKYMTQDLNTFNGKYNAFHESVDILYHWLYEYVMACLPDGKKVEY